MNIPLGGMRRTASKENAVTEHVYKVPDVSCEHCVSAITKELSQIEGVKLVDVNLESKQVTVKAEGTVTDQQLRAGIEEAGYDIAA
jgi:copper chaperone